MSGKKAKASKSKAVAKAKSKPAKAGSSPAKSKKKAVKAAKPARPAKPTKAKPVAKASKPAKAKPAPQIHKPAAKRPAAKSQKAPKPVQATAGPVKGKLPPFPIKGARRPFPTPTSAVKHVTEKPRPLSPKFLEKQRKNLLELRDHILDQMQGVANDSLKSTDSAPSSAFGMHQADAGSDAYEKDFALSLLSQEQDALYEVDEALKRIEQNTYGVCEMSGASIPVERLEAIPFARYTVQCQEQLEREQKGKNRWDTAPQFMDSAENFFEEEDDSEEESQKLKD